MSSIPYSIPSKAELKPHTQLLLSSDLAKAILLFIAGSLVIVFGGIAITLKTGIDWESILVWILWLGVAAFGFVFVRALLQLFASDIHAVASVIEAFAEVVTQRDLNSSGQIGDVRTIDQEPEVKETIRLVPTNKPPKVLQIPSGGEIAVDDFVEFVRNLEARGIERNKWVAENKKGVSYKFASGHVCDRPFYDGACEILEKRARVLHGRGKGTAGTLTAKPSQILNVLGLE